MCEPGSLYFGHSTACGRYLVEKCYSTRYALRYKEIIKTKARKNFSGFLLVFKQFDFAVFVGSLPLHEFSCFRKHALR